MVVSTEVATSTTSMSHPRGRAQNPEAVVSEEDFLSKVRTSVPKRPAVVPTLRQAVLGRHYSLRSVSNIKPYFHHCHASFICFSWSFLSHPEKQKTFDVIP